MSSVEGQAVSRLGTKVLIGAERDPNEPRKIVYRTKDIIAIPHDEARRHARDYQRLIDEGALVAHTEDEWRAQNEQREEAAKPREKLRHAEHPQPAKE